MLLEKRKHYKPFKYPWAYEGYKSQISMHWTPTEVSLAEDISDWNRNLTDNERNLLTQLFRFFTQADVSVAEGYIHKYLPLLGNHPEISMMMVQFAAMESIHIDAYSLLLDSIGMPELEYKAFQDYEEMTSKEDYLNNFNPESADPESIALALAVYSGFTEGLQLFSSFAMLLNFQRFGKMKGMGQIVTWSIRDESLHVKYMIQLFHTFCREYIPNYREKLESPIRTIASKMVEHEEAFIDLAFEMGNIEGLDKDDVKLYVKYLCDYRLNQLGFNSLYGVEDNPLTWIDDMLNLREKANFFELTATEYSKGSVKGLENMYDNTSKLYTNFKHEGCLPWLSTIATPL